MRLLHVEAAQSHPVMRRESSDGFVIVFYMDTLRPDDDPEGATFRIRQVSTRREMKPELLDTVLAKKIWGADFATYEAMLGYARKRLQIHGLPETLEEAVVGGEVAG